jgi:tetratricopeptide (TPR) repeat protein
MTTPRCQALLLATALLFVSLAAHAQNKRKEAAAPAPSMAPEAMRPIPKPTVKPNDEDTLNMSIYRLALKYGDANAARLALYMELAKTPTNLALKDSLATLYAISGASVQTNLVAKDILTKNPTDRKMLELLALSEQNLGRPKEALEAYEKLYPLSKNQYHLFQIATLQYNLKRLGECMISINAILESPESEKQKVNINMGQNQLGQPMQQEVPLRAAALNIRGVVMNDQKEKAAAKAAFEEALKLFPDFVLAKNNLADMQKEAAPKK